MKLAKKLLHSPIFIPVFMGVISVLVIAALFRASAAGTAFGSRTGTLVGGAVGSFFGITEGIPAGTNAGEQDGLSAKDTEASIKSTMETTAKLDVLAAGVTLKNFHELGDSYKELSLIKGDVVFSVDLTQAVLTCNEDNTEVFVSLPEPELALYLDTTGTEVLAEVQKVSFTTDAEDGITAYINSMAQVSKRVEDSIANYDSLTAQARESAQTQVKQLVLAACEKSCTVYVNFL